jgi:hypothetical protein
MPNDTNNTAGSDCQERFVLPLLVIPKDAADPSRIEKLEKAGYLIIVTDHPEKVFVIKNATPPLNRNEKQQPRNRFNPETHPCNPNRGYVPPQRPNEMLVSSEGNETRSVDA